MAARLNLSGAAFASPLTGPTPAFGDNSASLATTAFVANATTGVVTVATSGGTTTLTAAQASVPLLLITGTLTSNATINVPNTGIHAVSNRTTGAFTVTVKTAAGTGVAVTQGTTGYLMADGTNVVLGDNDINGVAIGQAAAAPGAFSILSASTSFTLGANAGGNVYGQIAGAAGTTRSLQVTTNGIVRWEFGGANVAESGGNSGTDFYLARVGDTGTFLDFAFYATRATGALTIGNAAVTGGTINGTAIGATTPSTGAFTTLAASTPVALASGGTGVTTAAAARASLGLVAAGTSLQWTGGAIVTNGTYWFTVSAPYAGTINSMDYFTGVGSFTVAVQIAGASVTGLSAIAVSSATQANAAATAANGFAAGQVISVVVTAATSSPTSAVLNLRMTKA